MVTFAQVNMRRPVPAALIKNRHGRFQQSKLFERLLEQIVS
jgi:hypothetical protein